MTDPEQGIAIPVSPPFMGQEAGMDAILERVQKTLDGQGGRLAIVAESGTGKTRLLQEVARRTRLILVPCRGSVYRSQRPLADLSYALLDIDQSLPRDGQMTRLEQVSTDLNIPELMPVFSRLMRLPVMVDPLHPPVISAPSIEGEDTTDAPLSGSLDQATLTDAFDRLLDRLAEHQTIPCLCFDDLDEAGDLTRSIALQLLDRQGQPGRPPALIMATFVPGAQHSLYEAFGDETILLPNLPREETLALGAALLSVKRLSSGLADLLWETTKGHPLYITMLLESLLDGGHIVRSDKGKEAALLATGEAQVRPLADLLVERAQRLPDDPREVLQSASVLGDGFRMGVLSALCGQPQSEPLQDNLSALIEAGWLAQSGENREAFYRFTQRVKRTAIYESLPAERREGLHLKAGDYYAAPRAGWRLRTDYAVHHYFRAGQPKRALPVIEIALSRARSAAESERVVALYKLGIDAAAKDSELVLKQAEMVERLGDIYAAAGEYAQAAETYGQLGPSIVPLTLLGKLGLVLLTVDPHRATNVLERALGTVAIAEQEELRWRAEAGLIWGLALAGHGYEAIRRSRDSLGRLGDTVGFGSERALVRGVLGMVLYYEGDEQEAFPHLESARAGWGARGDQEGVMLINQVLIGLPKAEITRAWLKVILKPLLKT